MDWKIGTPIRDGIYVIKIKDEPQLGFLKLDNKEWLAYPGGFAVNTFGINTQLSAYIDPIIIPEYI